MMDEKDRKIAELEAKLAEEQKMASLGLLSAGIAHEIQNPLNFVINFSKMSCKLVSDLEEIVEDCSGALDKDDAEEMQDIAADLRGNMEKIQEHGNRAIEIIRGILLLSRGKDGEQLPTVISQLLHEYVWLGYHAMRALDKSFNVSIHEDYPESMLRVMVVPQDLSRAVLNIANNAFYAVHERWMQEGEAYKPMFNIAASYSDDMLEIRLEDNGTGMPQEVKEKLFHQTITTKPVGKGTGLGMSITYDLVKNRLGGDIEFETEEGRGTTFILKIPCRSC